MIRTTTGACLALLAVAAMAAWAAAPAQAEPEFQSWETIQYESEGESEDLLVPTTLSASLVSGGQAVLGIGIPQIACSTATATSSLETGSSPTIDLAPTLGGCSLGIFPVEINAGSCVLRAHLSSETEAGVFTGLTDIICPGGGQIVGNVKNSGETICTFRVQPQNGISGIKATDANKDTPVDFTLKSELTGVTVIVEKGAEGTCPFVLPPGTYTNGKYTANVRVTAKGVGGETPPSAVQPKNRKFYFGMEDPIQKITGSGVTAQEFNFDIGRVVCTFSNQGGDQQANTKLLSRMILLDEMYKDCGYQNEDAQVLPKSCFYYIDSGILEKKYEGSLSTRCTPGDPMVVLVTGCTVVIPDQVGPKGTGLRRMLFSTVGKEKNQEVRVEFKVSGMKYEEQGMGCPNPNIPFYDGTLTGTVDFKGEVQGGGDRRGFWVVAK